MRIVIPSLASSVFELPSIRTRSPLSYTRPTVCPSTSPTASTGGLPVV
jgi:hypothetical protein